MAGLVIVREGVVVGQVRDDGFWTGHKELSNLLLEAFDGRGVPRRESVESEGGGVADKVPSFAKPSDTDFYDLFKDHLSRNGYVLARAG